ncbi:multidrug ABC transporter ATP-binding protein [Thermosipho melanesiensis]|uniref:ABC transporter related n=2 Tax=Thermosipho melanesiensis TaxID=46541 RepID=A6LJB0_THEM4|nr:ABC transporter ATP-binding protein [Thermosipho melanesiensis]ABR30011.1 ABC transporter related [Thermosipho melanesiensis BI429]APT73215.1 multidrug ABC transporter ATP-binding protein [Thermosipho melanesiensis]OOC38608.1 multidrug ABC transporter ATP-binding protein [Thermosipho melanesiensis]OOC40412.1 multidrug ABC transporter ATP-binding protein [Thermosipho melanesiensis]OOC40676.1 multidrug ABC transporter ATP-binding protein [Thermosipho melanesiensis]
MRKLFKYLKKYSFLIFLTLFFVTIQAILNLYLPDLMADIVDKGVARGNVEYIWSVGWKMLGITLLNIAAAVISTFFAARIAMGFGKDLRSMLFKKVMNFSLNEVDKYGVSTLINRNTNDVTQIQNVMFMMLRIVALAPVTAIGGTIMAISKSPKLSMILLVSLPIMFVAMFFIVKYTIPLFKSMQKKLDKLNRVLRENLTGVRVIRAFAKTEYEKQRFEDANEDLTRTALKVNRVFALVFPIILLVMNITIVFLIWIGAIQVDKGALEVGNLMAVMQYIMQIMFSFIMISVIFIFLPRATASAERISQVLDEETKIKEIEIPKKLSNIEEIEFKDVVFYYEGGKEPAISNASFDIKKGEVVGIIGSSGSGKSTLVKLLMRFYDATSGKIYINGLDVKEFSQKTLRERISLTPSRPVIFSGTIEDNVRIGKKDATEEEIIEALKIAQAWEFVSKLPDGIKTKVSQGGTNLSGGQKQRLAIARAIVGKKDVYIFDDSFSALDFRTDAKLRRALREKLFDATKIIVSLRVATVMNADKIIVLENGKVVGIGTHKELMNTCTVYKEIVSSQLSEEEIA